MDDLDTVLDRIQQEEPTPPEGIMALPLLQLAYGKDQANATASKVRNRGAAL